MGRTYLIHSAKGSTWEDHKYVKKVNGVYFYPPGYDKGRTIDSEKAKELMRNARDKVLKKGSETTSEKEKEKKGKKVSASGKKKEEKEKKPHVPKAAVDPKDRKAVLNRINETLGKSGKVKVKPKAAQAKKKTSEETSEKNQNLAEQLVDKLSDAKISVEDLKVDYSSAEKEDKAAIKKQLNAAQAELKKIQNQIKIKTKNNKELKKFIRELSSD